LTRSDLSFFYAESHRSIKVTTALSASPRPTTAPDPGAAVEDDGPPKPGLRKENDAPEPPLVNREINANTMATQDVPLYPPALTSVTDSNVANATHPLWGPHVEHAGDHPPKPSRNQYDQEYDIV
jgi:hypothetical protein